MNAHSTTNPASRPVFRTCACGTDFLPPFPGATRCRECHRTAMKAAPKRECACGTMFVPPQNAPRAEQCQRCYRAAKTKQTEAQAATATLKKRAANRETRVAKLRDLYIKNNLVGDGVTVTAHQGKKKTQVVIAIAGEGSYTFYV